MFRVNAYIDGYNLYHAIDNLCSPRNDNGHTLSRNKNFLKWVNLRKLVENYCNQPTHELNNIYYFSAPPIHLSESKQKRHAAYIQALNHLNVIYVEGSFKLKGTKWIKRDDGIFIEKGHHEEKESDVNIAIHILRDAILKSADKAIVITNDSDIAPAIRMAKKINPAWRATIITPPIKDRKYVNRNLLEATGQRKRNRHGQVFRETKIISEQLLLACQLPDEIILQDGTLVKRPDKYKVPPEYR